MNSSPFVECLSRIREVHQKLDQSAGRLERSERALFAAEALLLQTRWLLDQSPARPMDAPACSPPHTD